jgi:predicted acyl esterase
MVLRVQSARVRWLVALASACAFMVLAPAANATITSVFSGTPAPIPCAVQGSGVRLCDQTIAGNPGGTARSTVKTFDNVPIDVRVAFPPAPPSGPDGPYPLVMMFHGYAGSKLSLSTMQPLLDHGYATFSMTTRGFGESCGTSASRTAAGAFCNPGYVRLLDTRYEVRDAQEFAGLLADEGHTSFTQIGAIGGSYGGGLSMALAALKNRKMLPDGSLVPWTSPLGTPMKIAAATPEIPWTDLAYALLPNGSTLDYVADATYQGRSGVLKYSFENALYNSGLSFNYAAAGADPDADLRNWHTLFNNGEPYDDASGNPLAAVADVRDELTTHHSSYYINHSQAPAPLLISSGWTDDLFPPDEAIRFYNRTRTEFPSADISLFFADLGHPRGQNKAADLAVRQTAELAWLDYYVKGVGSVPFHGVTAYTETCPSGAASGGPFTAGTWGSLAPGEVRLQSAAAKTIATNGNDFITSIQFDPINGGGACGAPSDADIPNTATYKTAAVPSPGLTLLGSPTVIADITSAGSNSQIAARLVDIDPVAHTELLVARGLWRPKISATPVNQVFQLHPNGYKFQTGHIVKLELLSDEQDAYGRHSNGQQAVTIQNLDMRLPTVETPGALGGFVTTPVPKVLPAGYAFAVDSPGHPYVRPKAAGPLRVSLVPAFAACLSADETHGPPLAFGSCSSPDQTSTELTVGTPDVVGNGQPAKSVGLVKYSPIVGAPALPDDSDIGITVSITYVRKKSDLSDYTGQLQATSTVRLTDKTSGATGDEPATVQDTPFPVTVPCAATGDTTVGSTCSVSTTFDAVMAGSVPEGKRSVWEFGDVLVNDGGPDGVVSTLPNTLFARQGVFVP